MNRHPTGSEQVLQPRASLPPLPAAPARLWNWTNKPGQRQEHPSSGLSSPSPSLWGRGTGGGGRTCTPPPVYPPISSSSISGVRSCRPAVQPGTGWGLCRTRRAPGSFSVRPRARPSPNFGRGGTDIRCPCRLPLAQNWERGDGYPVPLPAPPRPELGEGAGGEGLLADN